MGEVFARLRWPWFALFYGMSPELEEVQLCISCMAPNDPTAHFCAECGAPLSSYASTGPFESLFARGVVYRQAAESPRKPIVVLGVWLIFGPVAVAGGSFIAGGHGDRWMFAVTGVVMLAFSAAIIARTTWNYFALKKHAEKPMVEL
jgi:ribosomal protein L40E